MLMLAAETTIAQQGGFRFSQPDESERAEREARAGRIADALATPCRADLKNKKIMVVIGERKSDGQVVTDQPKYGPHYQAINQRLRKLGLATYTPEEISRQIRQAELDAQFKNDVEAARSASKRLGASFVLRGLVMSESQPNPTIAVNQVKVTMDFTLTSSDGRAISTADSRAASFAGEDVARMALTLVDEQADEVVATLYADYCRKAGLGETARPTRK